MGTKAVFATTVLSFLMTCIGITHNNLTSAPTTTCERPAADITMQGIEFDSQSERDIIERLVNGDESKVTVPGAFDGGPIIDIVVTMYHGDFRFFNAADGSLIQPLSKPVEPMYACI